MSIPNIPDSKSRTASSAFPIIALCCLGFMAYSNSFHSPFQYDDWTYVVNNPAIKTTNWQYIWSIWPTRFIHNLSIALNYHLGALNVFSYHVFNFLAHLGSAILVWWLAILIFDTPAIKKEVIASYRWPIAFFASAIFLLHPIQTQPVNFIHQRSTLLATFFYIATLVLYAKARLSQQAGARPHISIACYGAAFVTALMSMFSKEISITLPLAICLFELCFLRAKTGFSWKLTALLISIILISVLISSMAFTLLAGSFHRAIEVLTTNELRTWFPISPWHYFLTQLNVKVTYLRLFLLPVGQSLDYDYPLARSFFVMPVIISSSILLLILAAAAKLFRKYRMLSFGILWFFITLLPESSILSINDVIVEHRLYLPMVGLSISLASGFFYLFGQKRFKYAVIALSLLVACYAAMTYERNKVWQSAFNLWDDTIKKSPRKARPYLYRGNAYVEKRDLDRAISDYTIAIRLKPKYADAYFNRGLMHIKKGDLDSAFFDFNKAISINPYFADAYNNRGNIYATTGDIDLALSDFNKAISLNPHLPDAYNNRAIAYFKKQEYDKSWADIRKAQLSGYKVDPGFIEELKRASGRGR